MKKEWLILSVIAVIIVIIVILDLGKPANKNPQVSSSQVAIKITSGNRQEKEEANVTVVAEYLPAKSDGKNMAFNIALDTHSVDLDAFDFEKDIVLEAGGKSTIPSKATTSGSGHHRSGEIVFPYSSPPFTIILKNLAGVEKREFRFEKI